MSPPHCNIGSLHPCTSKNGEEKSTREIWGLVATELGEHRGVRDRTKGAVGEKIKHEGAQGSWVGPKLGVKRRLCNNES